MDTGGEGEVGTNSESGVDIYTVVVAVKLLSCVRLFCDSGLWPLGFSVQGISLARILE